MSTTTHYLTIETISCGSCGCAFGIEVNKLEQLRRTHETFYCPNGHPRVFKSESEEERLKRELTRERAEHDQTKADAEKKTKQLERVACGVCPCCNRTFRNLQRHMQTKHKKISNK